MLLAKLKVGVVTVMVAGHLKVKIVEVQVSC